MKKIIRVSFGNTPIEAMQLWNPKFRTYTDAQLMAEIRNYQGYGYVAAFFCIDTATIFLTR